MKERQTGEIVSHLNVCHALTATKQNITQKEDFIDLVCIKKATE